MDRVFEMSRSLLSLAVSCDPATRNAVLMCACIVIYGIFLCREQQSVRRRGMRPLRCADSVLRG